MAGQAYQRPEERGKGDQDCSGILIASSHRPSLNVVTISHALRKFMKVLKVGAGLPLLLALVSETCLLSAETKALRSPVTMQILDQRKLRQQTAAKNHPAFYGLQFTNRVQDSRITFENRVVDDAGKTYQAAHYDHGNGMAVADIDGDGLLDIYFTTQLGKNQLWRNRGGGKFEDATALAQVALEDQISVGAAFADVDNDGAPDLFVTR